MKFTYTTLTVATIVGQGFAQTSMPALPACAEAGVLAAFAATGCATTDIECICSNQKFLDQSEAVVKKDCTGADIAKANAFALAFCAPADVTSHLPSSVPATYYASTTSVYVAPTTTSCTESTSSTSTPCTTSTTESSTSCTESTSSTSTPCTTSTTESSTSCTSTTTPYVYTSTTSCSTSSTPVAIPHYNATVPYSYSIYTSTTTPCPSSASTLSVHTYATPVSSLYTVTKPVTSAVVYSSPAYSAVAPSTTSASIPVYTGGAAQRVAGGFMAVGVAGVVAMLL